MIHLLSYENDLAVRLFEMHKRHLKADVKVFSNYQEQLIQMDITAMWYLTQGEETNDNR